VFGGIGGSYFYCGREDLGFTVIASLVLSIIVPAVSPIFMIIVLGGFIHTAYVVDEANRNIKRECEILCKE
jgi:Na+-transporting methylmalonyl-CoA/oxaloacetate decarboxylase beta subunit